jgi:hypothetical protein
MPAPFCVWKSPSMAASLTGWWSVTCRPSASPLGQSWKMVATTPTVTPRVTNSRP